MKWQSTSVFSPEKSHGQRSLVGYSPKGHKELNTTEQLNTWISSIELAKLGKEKEGTVRTLNTFCSGGVKRYCFKWINRKNTNFNFLNKELKYNNIERLPLWAVCYAGIYTGNHDLHRGGFWSRIRDEAWLLGAFCVAKFILKYNRNRESFWHGHQKGTERVLLC